MANALVLIGSGVVGPDAWAPVRRALRKQFPHSPDEDPNLVFANLIFELRWAAQALAREPEAPEKAVLTAFLQDRMKTYEALKKDLAQELEAARAGGEIKLRAGAHNLLPRFCVGDEVQVITTNWDLCLTDAFDAPAKTAGLKFIHGNVLHPESLYLPTEMTYEPFRPATDVAFGVLLKGAFMSMNLVAHADRLIVHGLSVSPLDAELGVLLGQGARLRKAPFEKVTVIDPAPDLVIARLRFFFGDQLFESRLLDALS